MEDTMTARAVPKEKNKDRMVSEGSLLLSIKN